MGSGEILDGDTGSQEILNGVPQGGGYSDAEIDALLANKMSDLSDDTTPQLGGELDANGNAIVAADHGTAATDQVVNVCYGTGSPPAANTTTIGALFVKYIA